VIRSPWTENDKTDRFWILEARMRKASPLTGQTGDSSHTVSSALTRRRFLFAFGATSVGAAAAPVLVSAAQATSATVETAKSSGYRETEHVRDYYDSARI